MERNAAPNPWKACALSKNDAPQARDFSAEADLKPRASVGPRFVSGLKFKPKHQFSAGGRADAALATPRRLDLQVRPQPISRSNAAFQETRYLKSGGLERRRPRDMREP
jgi:hypothetical protein